MKRGMTKLLAVFAIIILAAGFASAAVPTKMAVQGKLVNSTSGELVSSADLRVLITNSSGTVYDQTHSNAVSNGLFYLTIGETTSLNLNYNQDYNMSLFVDGSSTAVGGNFTFRGGQGQVSTEDITDSYLLNTGDSGSGAYTFTGAVTVNSLVISSQTSCTKLYADGSGNILCGNDTTNVTAGDGLTGGGEDTTVTLNIGAGTGITVNADSIEVNNSVVPFKSSAETITATWTFPSLIVTGDLFLQGNLTRYNVADLNINGSMMPHFNDMFDLGNSSQAWSTGYFATNVLVGGNAVITNTTSPGGNISGQYGNLQLGADSVIGTKITDGSIGSADLADLIITSAKLADNSVNASHILDANITTAKIVDLAITSAKINDSAVTSAKLADLAVTSVKIADDAVNSSHIADLNVTTAKIEDGAITSAKMDSSITLDDLQIGNNSDGDNEYIRIDVNTTTIPSTDCDAADEAGRMIFSMNESRLMICNGTAGWTYVDLTALT